MMPDSKPYTLDRVVRLGIGAGLLVGLLWLLSYLSPVLIPFAAALLLAYLLNPLVLLVERWVHNHAAAVLISLGAVLAVGVIAAAVLVPLMMSEIGHMGKVLSALASDADLARRASEKLPPDLWQAVREYGAREDVQAFFKTENFWKIAETVARKVLPGVKTLITGTMSTVLMVLTGVATIGLYLVFLLSDYRRVKEGWKELIPAKYRGPVVEFVQDFDQGMARYFRGQATVAAIVGVLFAVGFRIIGLPMGILLGLFIGLLNMVPYLQTLGLVPAAFLAVIRALETQASIWTVLGCTLLVFVVVQAIQELVLVPRIMGKITGLRPSMILLSLSVWGKLLGVLGLLIALPMTCLLLAYYRRLLATDKAERQSARSAGG